MESVAPMNRFLKFPLNNGVCIYILDTYVIILTTIMFMMYCDIGGRSWGDSGYITSNMILGSLLAKCWV